MHVCLCCPERSAHRSSFCTSGRAQRWLATRAAVALAKTRTRGQSCRCRDQTPRRPSWIWAAAKTSAAAAPPLMSYRCLSQALCLLRQGSKAKMVRARRVGQPMVVHRRWAKLACNNPELPRRWQCKRASSDEGAGRIALYKKLCPGRSPLRSGRPEEPRPWAARLRGQQHLTLSFHLRLWVCRQRRSKLYANKQLCR